MAECLSHKTCDLKKNRSQQIDAKTNENIVKVWNFFNFSCFASAIIIKSEELKTWFSYIPLKPPPLKEPSSDKIHTCFGLPLPVRLLWIVTLAGHLVTLNVVGQCLSISITSLGHICHQCSPCQPVSSVMSNNDPLQAMISNHLAVLALFTSIHWLPLDLSSADSVTSTAVSPFS